MNDKHVSVILCSDWIRIKLWNGEFIEGHSINPIDLLRELGHTVTVTEYTDDECEDALYAD